jgi:hypothetical protein
MNVPHSAPIANSPTPIQYIYPLSRLQAPTLCPRIVVSTKSGSDPLPAPAIWSQRRTRTSIERYRPDTKALAPTGHTRNLRDHEQCSQKRLLPNDHSLFQNHAKHLKVADSANARGLEMYQLIFRLNVLFEVKRLPNFCRYVHGPLHDFLKISFQES